MSVQDITRDDEFLKARVAISRLFDADRFDQQIKRLLAEFGERQRLSPAEREDIEDFRLELKNLEARVHNCAQQLLYATLTPKQRRRFRQPEWKQSGTRRKGW